MCTLIEIKSIIYRQIFCLASISAAIKLRNTKRLIECNILYFGMDHYSLERGGWAIPRKKKTFLHNESQGEEIMQSEPQKRNKPKSIIRCTTRSWEKILT